MYLILLPSLYRRDTVCTQRHIFVVLNICQGASATLTETCSRPICSTLPQLLALPLQAGEPVHQRLAFVSGDTVLGDLTKVAHIKVLQRRGNRMRKDPMDRVWKKSKKRDRTLGASNVAFSFPASFQDPTHRP